MKKYDVFGIGAALMDFLIEIEDDQLAEFDLKKGEMHLIDKDKSQEIFKRLSVYKVTTSPGGSSANTLAGIASLGGKVVFCGRIGNDKYGEIYEQKSNECGVCTKLKKDGENMTGHAISFITPDSERTFATHLGAAIHLREEDVFYDDIEHSKILHIEGYQLEDPELRKTSLKAMSFAKKHNTQISIDLADPALVKRNLHDLKNLVKDNADIIFANEEEAKAFTGKENPEEALDELSNFCSIAIVKIGKKGSLIKKEGKICTIAGIDAAAVDTTGAGDMYAAGVLFGIAKNFSLERSGKIGSWAASKVVSQIGARLNICLKDELDSIK